MTPTLPHAPLWSEQSGSDSCNWSHGNHQGGTKLSSMRQAARDGCVRCKLLLRGIEKYTFLPCRPYRTTEATLSEYETHRNLIVDVRNDPYTPLRVTVQYLYMDTRSGSLPMKLNFYTLPDMPPYFSDIGPAGHIPADPASQACFDTIREWIRKCNTLHPQCSPKTDMSTTPTRLISVGSSSDDIKLCSSSEMPADARYVALSHTWGVKEERVKAMPLLLTKDLSARLLGISWHELTQTFQDAITITRDIGIPYVWIDSLCVVQDDQEDWAKEASRMASVYKYAYLVIAATSSKNGDDGCLRPRVPSYDLSDPVNGSFHVQRQMSHFTISGWQADSIDMPLLVRAWCFQERLLARRILHYMKREMMWECQKEVWCECQTIQFDVNRPPTRSNFDIPLTKRLDTFKLFHAAAMASPDSKIRVKSWDRVVKEYSRLALTFSTDRLTAISGIAREIARPEMGTYLAGLWEYQLPRALLWASEGTVIDRPSQYLAPTWSWASIVTAVSPFGWRLGAKSMNSVCRLIDITCTPNTSDLYGHVRDGQLKISGPTIAATLQCTDPTCETERQQVLLVMANIEVAGKCVDLKMRSDIKLMEATVPVVILVMRVELSTTIQNAEGLVLIQSKTHTGCWERIGVVDGMALELPQMKESEFVIV